MTTTNDLEIPPTLIAQTPQPRNTSRLLHRTPDGHLTHEHVANLPKLLPKGALIVLNDTRVFPARILATPPPTGLKGAKIRGHPPNTEIFFLTLPTKISTHTYQCQALAKPARKLTIGQTLQLPAATTAKVIATTTQSSHKFFTLQINCPHPNILNWLEEHAHVPLPPYIKRNTPPPAKHSPDYHQYQTVYANPLGSVAAPTAGLHFSKEILDKLIENGIEVAYLTLHVSAGTFLPIKTKNFANHYLPPEKYFLPQSTWLAIDKAKKKGRPIVAVGTTTFRALETSPPAGLKGAMMRMNPPHLADNQHPDCPIPPTQPDHWHETSLYLFPQKQNFIPKIADALFTNFHHPDSSLFLLVCALIGQSATTDLYHTAVSKRYRFLSYGDACLLWLKSGFQ